MPDERPADRRTASDPVRPRAPGALPAPPLPPSFPDHVRQTLEREIVEGVLTPGEWLSEWSLARRLGVSRTPIREALRLLQAQGLIVRHRDRGVVVAQRTTPEEARALYRMRLPLEGFLTARAAERIGPDEVRTLRELQRAFRAVLDETDGGHVELRRLMDIDSEFHTRIYAASASDLASILDSYWGRLQRELYGRVYGAEPPNLFARQHEWILDALEARDGAAAQVAMEAHIESGWRAIEVSFGGEGRVVRSADPEPVEKGQTLAAAGIQSTARDLAADDDAPSDRR